jgi:hypothetical protein
MPPGTLENYPIKQEIQPEAESGSPLAEDTIPLNQEGELVVSAFKKELAAYSADDHNELPAPKLTRFKEMAAKAIDKVADIPIAIKAKKGKSSLPWGVCKCGCQKIAKLFNHEYGT